jgi:hypothetical protein
MAMVNGQLQVMGQKKVSDSKWNKKQVMGQKGMNFQVMRTSEKIKQTTENKLN